MFAFANANANTHHLFRTDPTDPKSAPLLPKAVVSTVARFCFNVLTIPLIFSTIASSVTIDSLGDYWSVMVGAAGVLTISFVTATVLARCLLPKHIPVADISALRVAATFPNIVALPILIFPSLCEYEVVYQAFGTSSIGTETAGEDEDRAELYRQCVAKSNTMIFCYFFGWSLLFWSFGHPVLMNAAQTKRQQGDTDRDDAATSDNDARQLSENGKSPQQSTDLTITNTDAINDSQHDSSAIESAATAPDIPQSGCRALAKNLKRAVCQVFSSPPFIAMILAFFCGCISPIRNLLFSPGGQLRFLGAALETLGKASSPLSTMVVAASLASSSQYEKNNEELRPDTNISSDVEDNSMDCGARGSDGSCHDDGGGDSSSEGESHKTNSDDTMNPDSEENVRPVAIEEESPVMSDPNFGPLHLRRRSSVHRFRASISRNTMKALEKARRTPFEQRRLYVWFTLSRLILSPALVVMAIVGLDCSGALVAAKVPDLVKLVLIVNSSVPGALIIVVLLKSNPDLHETAAVVAKVYFPTYIISIVTIAAWTAVGLLVSIPDDEGNSFCTQWQY